MFSWITSPQLPDTIDTQAFRSVGGQGPILRINTINDRSHKMKVIPWEDILEVFPNAVYLLDASGIVLPARDNLLKRIIPKSIKLQADVVLQVVSSQDIPPKSTVPENIEKIEAPAKGTTAHGITEGLASSSLTPSAQQSRSSTSSASGSFEAHAPAQGRFSSSSRTSYQEKTSTSTAGAKDSDWSPFQANNASTFSATSVPATASAEQLHILRQEMVHRLELLSAEQEERFQLILEACHRPGR